MDLQQILQNQPTINIGMIGSVSNGKSSLTYQITKTRTQKHSSEQTKNITIKLGYANAKIYKCITCPEPECYQSFSSATMECECGLCGNSMVLQKHVSFVDCPGHNLLMATMLNGTCVMDTSIIVESVVNKEIPSMQTKEHMIAAEVTGLDCFATCINKIDLVEKKDAIKYMESLSGYMGNSCFKDTKIIPISANFGINVDTICEYICKHLEEPKRDLAGSSKMIIIRSFNINHPDVSINEIEGGVVGGSISRGTLKIGDSVMIYPGFLSINEDVDLKGENGKPVRWVYEPIETTVISINSEKNKLNYAIPGGLIGVGLTIDPAITTGDNLVGSILTTNNDSSIYNIMETIFVVFSKVNRGSDIKLIKDDILVVNHNASNSKGKIVKIRGDKIEIQMIEKPICVEIDEYITLSKSIGSAELTIIGRAQIKDGYRSYKL